MKLSKAIAVSIWVLALFLSLLPSPIRYQAPIQGFSPVLVLFPALFFPVTAFFISGYPFDVELLRRWADQEFGKDAYAGFIRQIKPVLLCVVASVTSGISGFVRALEDQNPGAAFWQNAFILSAGGGFLLMRLVLAKRGLLMESRTGQAGWDDRQFLLQKIRNLRATWLTAILAGGWTAFGTGIEQALRPRMDKSTYDSFSLGASVIFFFIPLFLFVLGVPRSDGSKMRWLSKDGLRREGQLLGRVLCWMLGVVLFGMVYQVLRDIVAGSK